MQIPFLFSLSGRCYPCRFSHTPPWNSYRPGFHSTKIWPLPGRYQMQPPNFHSLCLNGSIAALQGCVSFCDQCDLVTHTRILYHHVSVELIALGTSDHSLLFQLFCPLGLQATTLSVPSRGSSCPSVSLLTPLHHLPGSKQRKDPGSGTRGLLSSVYLTVFSSTAFLFFSFNFSFLN